MNTASNKETAHSFQVRNYHLLNSAVIYGANASGKSNVLKAMGFMRALVLNRAKVTQSADTLPHEPFRLNAETEKASSWFEIIFFMDDVRYRYGFEADDEVVYAEWLFSDEKGKESRLFERDKEENIHYVNPKFKEAKGIKVPDNHLFLWRCDQNGGDVSGKIVQWFKSFNLIDGLEHREYVHIALRQMESEKAKSELLKLIKVADLGIEDMRVKEEKLNQDFLKNAPIPEELKQKLIADEASSIELFIQHKKFNEDNEEIASVSFKLEEDESQGTQKFFALSAPILDTLQKGKVLLVDELDASLHPMLTEYLIKLFHNSALNKHHAQLIFTTHDSHLLAEKLFERDQIWFTEKDQYGNTELYSLLEFRKKNTGVDVRENDNLEKRYLEGRFGGVPYMGNLE
jgi:AAA15 family ATPase/GTPase